MNEEYHDFETDEEEAQCWIPTGSDECTQHDFSPESPKAGVCQWATENPGKEMQKPQASYDADPGTQERLAARRERLGL